MPAVIPPLVITVPPYAGTVVTEALTSPDMVPCRTCKRPVEVTPSVKLCLSFGYKILCEECDA